MKFRFPASGSWRIALLTTTVFSFAAFATAAQASLAISANPTKFVTCSSGVCTATAKNATLNVTDLRNMLATSNVRVVPTSKVNDIIITYALSWVSANALTLDSYHSITINQPVSITGSGGLTLTTNDGGTGGTLSFGKKGNVNFWSLSSSLTINGNAYTLVNNVATLTSDIASNASGFYALAANYNATPDGTYAASPIQTIFTGTFEGLGNTISHLKINNPDVATNEYTGLFTEVDYPGMIENLGLTNVSVKGPVAGGLVGRLDQGSLFDDRASGWVTSEASGGTAGGLAGISDVAHISHSYSTATVSGKGTCTHGCGLGGLVGTLGAGTIDTSYATGAVKGGGKAGVGGLVGYAQAASINQSYATGTVTGGWKAMVGGFVGESIGNDPQGLTNDYATGPVTGGMKASVGGFVGLNGTGATLSSSYSTGIVSGSTGSLIGGFVGNDTSGGAITESYWDTTTGGISQAAGNIANDPGITGMTTSQLQSGLPAGFSNSIWGESVSINDGLPYLLTIPPT